MMIKMFDLAIAYADSVNSVVAMICLVGGEYLVYRIRNASQRG